MPDLTAPANAVCLTIGDPTGIGPEIAVKFLQHATLHPDGPKLIVYGDIGQLARTAQMLHCTLPETERIRYENIQNSGFNQPEKLPGTIAYESLEAAVSTIHAGQARVLVTGPISKENLEAANIPFSGHTEILQQLARKLYQKPCQSDMLFLYRQFRMLLLTRHVPLRRVSESLSIKGVVQSLSSLSHFLREHCHIEKPRLCMLGINPHAGELDGDEEERILLPASHMVSAKYGFDIAPPVAADAAFRHFDVNNLRYDAYVAAYHDQGLIPFKMVAGLSAVNVTIGLPFLRTSVSHGTAPDIVGQGIADPASLIEAYNTAVQLTGPEPSPQLPALMESWSPPSSLPSYGMMP
jgi:4-hydroxythreonine-4-phosphate dehydrogenase